MKILITNDDGIDALGIKKLAEIALKIADEVYVVAPLEQRSGVSHGITVMKPLIVKKVPFSEKVTAAYSVSGNPADCVKVALKGILKDIKIDYVLSGINRGYNMGFDCVYSGTVGAARDARFQHIPAIAVSTWDYEFELVDLYLEEILKDLMKRPLSEHELWNVNFPKDGKNTYKGIKETNPSSYSYYLDVYAKKQIDEDTSQYTLEDVKKEEFEKGSDFEAVNQGYISVEKINCDIMRVQ